MKIWLARFAARLVSVALITIPQVASAQAASGGCATGNYGTIFNPSTQGLAAAGGFFYGPAFKWGMLIVCVVTGIMVALDDGQLPQIAKWVIRIIAILSFVLGIGAWITTPAQNCS